MSILLLLATLAPVVLPTPITLASMVPTPSPEPEEEEYEEPDPEWLLELADGLGSGVNYVAEEVASLMNEVFTDDDAVEGETKEINGKMYRAFIPDKNGYYKFGPKDKSGTVLLGEGKQYLEPSFRTKWYYIKRQHYLVMGKTYWCDKDIWDGFHILLSSNGPPEAVDPTIMEMLEAMLASFVTGLATALHWMINRALGRTVTMDDIIFNRYPETYLGFWPSEVQNKEHPDEYKSSLIYGLNVQGGKSVGGLNTVINQWYAIFFRIALTGYMVILVYMGIRILLTSTAEKKAEFQRLFMDWVVGLAILFLFPYMMKYIVKINNAFVAMVDANKGYTVPKSAQTTPLKNGDDSVSFKGRDARVVDAENEIDWSTGRDYMSVMGDLATQSEKLGMALAFLILTWQLMALVVHYYKRLFMLAFLIVLFPLVALSYAIDKVADGKSQALNTWIKEYILNVFVQSFHAIIYVFICSTVYSASGVNESAGYDFILIIIGVTFLFKGEKIIRQIFGQVSSAGTMGDLGQSAAMTYAAFAFTKNAVKKVGSATIGENSIGRKGIQAAKGIYAIHKQKQALKDGMSDPPPVSHPESRINLAGKNPAAGGKRPPFATQAEYEKNKKIEHAAYVLSNPNSHSKIEQAEALQVLKETAQENPNHEVFKKLNMTAGQVAALAGLDNLAQQMHKEHVEKVEIEREVQAQLDYILHANKELTPEAIQALKEAYITENFLNRKSNMIKREDIDRDIHMIADWARNMDSSFVFATGNISDKDMARTRREAARFADQMVAAYGGKDALSKEEQAEIRKYAAMIAAINMSDKGSMTADKAWSYTEALRDAYHGNGTFVNRERIKEMTENYLKGGDIDSLAHVVAKKLANADVSTLSYAKETFDSSTGTRGFDATGVAERLRSAQARAKQVASEYEADPRRNMQDDTRVSIHEVIAHMDGNAREKIDQIKGGIHLAQKGGDGGSYEYAKSKKVERDLFQADVVREIKRVANVKPTQMGEAIGNAIFDVKENPEGRKHGDLVEVVKEVKNSGAEEFARNLAIVNQSQDGIFSQKQIAEATKYIQSRMEKSSEIDQYVRGKVSTVALGAAITIAAAHQQKEQMKHDMLYTQDDANSQLAEDFYNENRIQTGVFMSDSRVNRSSRDRLEKFAENVAIIEQRDTGAYSAEEISRAVDYVQDSAHESAVLSEEVERRFGALDLSMISQAATEKAEEERVETIQDSIRFKPEITDEVRSQVLAFEQEAEEELTRRYQAIGSVDTVSSLSHSIMVLKERDTGVHSAEEIEQAIEDVRDASSHIGWEEYNRTVVQQELRDNPSLNDDPSFWSSVEEEKKACRFSDDVRRMVERELGHNIDQIEYMTKEKEIKLESEAQSITEKYREEGGEGSVASVAEDIAILKDMNSGNYSEKQIFEAAERLHDLSHASEQIKEDNEVPEYLDKIIQAELGTDIDTMMTAISDKIVTDGIGTFSGLSEAEANEIMSKARNHQEAVKKEEDPLDYLVDRMYAIQRKDMEDFMGEMAKDYLVENQVDIAANHLDSATAIPTVEGYTKAELSAMQMDIALQALSSMNIFHGKKATTTKEGSVGVLGEIAKRWVEEEQMEHGYVPTDEEHSRLMFGKAKTRYSENKESYVGADTFKQKLGVFIRNRGHDVGTFIKNRGVDVDAMNYSAMDVVEENRKKRERIQDEHYYGDIGDRRNP